MDTYQYMIIIGGAVHEVTVDTNIIELLDTDINCGSKDYHSDLLTHLIGQPVSASDSNYLIIDARTREIWFGFGEFHIRDSCLGNGYDYVVCKYRTDFGCTDFITHLSESACRDIDSILAYISSAAVAGDTTMRVDLVINAKVLYNQLNRFSVAFTEKYQELSLLW